MGYFVKMVSLYKDPNGKDVFTKTAPAISTSEQQPDSENLRQRIKELETELEKKVQLMRR